MLFLVLLLLAPSLNAQPAEITAALLPGDRVENILLPFTTDGCSSFPNGIPYKDENRWLKCCVIHDISYWQGGTAAQRKTADKTLRQCVADTGEKAIAEAMYLGVRAGGAAGLPTSWRWGYGWTLDRRYAPLSAKDEDQVRERLKALPARLEDIPIQRTPAIPQRRTLTGDYCVDAALEHMMLALGRGFTMTGQAEEEVQAIEGLLKVISITAEGCKDSFRYTFLLSRPDACQVPASEIVARGRIRLAKIEVPAACTPAPAE